jgi:predicted ester cyclase
MTDADKHYQKSQASLRVVKAMEKALGENADNMQDYFHEDFRWVGNTGCGIKEGIAEFRRNWQLPLRAAFTERIYKTERFLADGDWVSCFGFIDAAHTGDFMGIAASGKRVRIPYIDFWQIKDGRIADNRVSVDFASVLQQLGRDVFEGEGWEAYDTGTKTPASP